MLGNGRSYRSIAARGLDRDSIPMRLFQKAKKLGVWDPAAIDLGRDVESWRALAPNDREFVLHNIALFQAGEESVTVDLLPLVMAVAAEGRLEEEIYLTSFLWEEAKHTEFFRHWLDQVPGDTGDLSRFFGDSYMRLFGQELPQAMNRLRADPSPKAMIRAAVTYNMIIEGVLAETGYHGFRQIGASGGGPLLPGLLEGIELVARDESRHIRYGLYLINRLINADPDGWQVMTERMHELLPLALGVTAEFFDRYQEGPIPFSQEPATFLEYAGTQFDRRMKVLERDRGRSLLEIERAAIADLEADDQLGAVPAN